MPDPGTETHVRAAAVPQNRVADCTDPYRPCRWEQERSEIMLALRDIRKLQMDQTRDIGEIKAAIAPHADKLTNDHARLNSLDDKVNAIAVNQARMQDSMSLLTKIVYGAVGLVLLAVGGALVGLVIVKQPQPVYHTPPPQTIQVP